MHFAPFESPFPTSAPSVTRFRRLSWLASLIVIGISLLVLLGWAFDIDVFTSGISGRVTQKPNTSFGLIASSAALVLWHWRSRRSMGRLKLWQKGLLWGLPSLVLLLGLVTLIEYGFQVDSGINRLSFEISSQAVDRLAEGRPAPNTAVSFVLIGLALLLLIRRQYRAVQSLSAIAFFVSGLALTGHLHAVSDFYQVRSVTGMAIPTAVSFQLLSVGLLFATADQGWMREVSSDLDGSLMIRRVLPLMIVVPNLLGALILVTYQQFALFPEGAFALRSVLGIVLFSIIIWWNGRSLNRIDAQRRSMQRHFSQELENQVAARTAELSSANQQLQQEIAERERVSTDLRESEARMRRAITLAPFPIIMHVESGEILALSQAFSVITGYTLEEVPTIADWTEKAYGDRQSVVQEAIESLYSLEHHIHEGEFSIRTKAGNTRIWDFSSAPLGDTSEGQPLVISMAADITLRKHMEIELEESRTQLQQQLTEIETIYRSAPIGLNVLDPDLRFVRINERLAEINGFSVKDHIGRTVRELLPDLADAAEQLLQPIFETGEPLLNVEIQGETPAQPGVTRVWRESFLPLKDGDRIIGINTVCEEITERRRTELALQEAQVQLEAALEAGSIYTWRWNVLEDRVFTDRQFAKLWGVAPKAAALGLPVAQYFEAIHPDDRLRVTAAIETAIATGDDYQAEYRICPVDADVRWVLARGRVDQGADGSAVSFPGVLIDITQRKQMEAALSQSESRYRTLFETMEEGFCVIDVLFDEAGKAVDYRFVEVNPAFEQQTGLYEATGKTALELVPDLEPHWAEMYGQVLLNGRSIRFENRSDALDRWFAVNAFPISASEQPGVAILFQEISDRKRTEITLAKRAEQQAEIAHIGQQAMASDALKFLDSFLDEVVVRVAQTLDVEYCKVLELLSDHRGMVLRAGVGWQDGLVGQAIISSDQASQAGYTLLAQEPVVVEDLRTERRFSGPALLTEHGVVSGMSTIIGNVGDAEGQPFGVIGVHTRAHRRFTQNEVNFLQAIANILSETISRHRVEREIRTINASLEQRIEERTEQVSEVNKELEAFAYSVSHDLRAPLRAIEGIARIIQEDCSDRLDATGNEYVQILIDSAAQMGGLIQDLLAYSRLGRRDIQLTVVNLSVVVDEALREVALDIEARKAHITIEDLHPVRAQRNILRQVLVNMIANAIKFVESDKSPIIRIWAEEQGQRVRVWVEDNGIGIDHRHHERIFQPFERLHGIEQYSGTGIGLAIVQRGMDRMGGRVGVQSTPGKGSRFWIELPQAENPAPLKSLR